MEDKITLEQVFEAGRRGAGVGRDHLATSVLLDLTRRALSEQEASQVLHHLALCSDCREDLKQMIEPEPDILAVAPPFVAVGPDTQARRRTARQPQTFTIQWLAAAAPDTQEPIVVDDDTHTVQCIVERQGERTLLTLQVKGEDQAAFEGQLVRVLNAYQQELCRGLIVGGTLFRIVSGQVVAPLTLQLGGEEAAEPPDRR